MARELYDNVSMYRRELRNEKGIVLCFVTAQAISEINKSDPSKKPLLPEAWRKPFGTYKGGSHDAQ